MQQSVAFLALRYSGYAGLASNSEVSIADRLGGDGYIRTALPSDQWKTEVRGWESTTWAMKQFMVSDYAIGPGIREPRAQADVTNLRSPSDKQMCGLQKMRKSGGFV